MHQSTPQSTSSFTPLRIAFIAFSKRADLFRQDPSYIYRCENLAMALQQLGHHCHLLHHTEFGLWQGQLSPIRCPYDIVVLHRPRAPQQGYRRWLAPLLRRQIRALQQQGVKVVADFDDLIFTPEHAAQSPGVVNQQVSLPQTTANFQSHLSMLELTEFVSLSTLPLLDQVTQAMGKTENSQTNACFLPNQAHLRWRQRFDAMGDQLRELKSPEPRLTYFPGTRSHDRDFASIAEPLSDFLHDHPEVELHITGHLNLEPSKGAHFQCRKTQLFQHPKQPFDTYAEHVAKSWVNLAPLENTLFNRHKSALKAIEAAYFNSPTIATPIPDMQRLEGAGSVLVNDHAPSDWYTQLQRAFSEYQPSDPAQSIRQGFLQQGSIEQTAQDWLAWLANNPANNHAD